MNKKALFIYVFIILLIPFFEFVYPDSVKITALVKPILIFTILGFALHIITGMAGILNLGIAGFMALGAYTYAIFSSEIYPFQFGFWGSILLTLIFGIFFGLIICLPTLSLKGDYLAVVTLGFGEIVQDTLKNLEVITKGTQGINPLPNPSFFGYVFAQENPISSYFFYFAIVLLAYFFCIRLQKSRTGKCMLAIREDELATSCMGIDTRKIKLIAFCISASMATFAGALWASYIGSTGEPSNYDFQISIITLCMIIVGGIGKTEGVLFGALIMMGLNSIIISQIGQYLLRSNLIDTTSVFLNPNNWKFLIFGLALVYTMKYQKHEV